MKAYHSYIVTSDKTCMGIKAQMVWRDLIPKAEGEQGMVFHFLGIRFILIFSADEVVTAYHYEEKSQGYVLCDPLYKVSSAQQQVLASLLSPWYVKFHMVDNQIADGEVSEIEIPAVDLSVFH